MNFSKRRKAADLTLIMLFSVMLALFSVSLLIMGWAYVITSTGVSPPSPMIMFSFFVGTWSGFLGVVVWKSFRSQNLHDEALEIRLEKLENKLLNLEARHTNLTNALEV